MAKAPEIPGEIASFSTSSDVHSRDQDSCRAPGTADIRRLMKAKAEHEQRLKVLRARVQIREDQENQAWKDVKLLQQRVNNQARFAQWQREVRKEEQLQLQKDVANYQEALKERARNVRASLQHTQVPRLEKFRENKVVAAKVREDSRRLLEALQDVRRQRHESKLMQVEVRKQQRKQQALRRQVEAARRDQLRQELNALRYAQLHEEVQRSEQDLALLEQQETAALSRLQHSQSVRESLSSQAPVAPRPSMATSLRAESVEKPVEKLLSASEVVESPETESQPRHHSSSHFAPLDDEFDEPTSPSPESPESPSPEVTGDQGDPSPKREGHRPKQPRGYGFSPKTRRASAGPCKKSAAPEADGPEASS